MSITTERKKDVGEVSDSSLKGSQNSPILKSLRIETCKKPDQAEAMPANDKGSYSKIKKPCDESKGS